MIKCNQLNQISTELLIVWACLGGWKILENDSVKSDYIGNSVESDLRGKCDVNETADL